MSTGNGGSPQEGELAGLGHEPAGSHLRNALMVMAEGISNAQPGRDGELVVPMHLVVAARNRVQVALDLVDAVRRAAATTGPTYTQEKARKLL